MMDNISFSMNRRHFFRNTSSALVAGSFPRWSAAASPVSTKSHVLDAEWPKLTPDSYPDRCQIAGVAIGKDGNILALNRGENHWDPKAGFKRTPIHKPAVLVIDPKSGGLVGSWGSDLFMMPHQISVDAAGNVWIVDCGLNTVFKFDAMGAKLLELGGPEIGFMMPTDVTSLSDGGFVVSDGYQNTRVVKFDSAGKLVAAWGTKGRGQLQFNTPHSIACDDNDLLYVADRENHRVQVLNAKGKVQAIWTNVERPLTIRHAADSLFVLSNLEAAKGIVRQFNKQGKVLASFPTKPAGTTEDFEWPHGLAVSADGSQVYVGFTLTGRRVQRYQRS